jgi:hypothetical protein
MLTFYPSTSTSVLLLLFCLFHGLDGFVKPGLVRVRSLLQLPSKSERSQTSNSRCLKFMHIPKTGGTSIESANLHLSREERVFDSLAVPIYERDAAIYHQTPGDLFDDAHVTKPTDSPLAQSTFYFLHWGIRANFTILDMPDGNKCQDIHTPPRYNQDVERYFGQAASSDPDRCTVFCVVREPVARMISAYKFWAAPSPGWCSAQRFEAWAREKLVALRTSYFQDDCHLLSQSDFVFGPKSPDNAKATAQYCDRILHQEDLKSSVNDLVAEFGFPPLLTNQTFFETTDCHIQSSDVSLEVKLQIFDFYKQDFETFGYPRPS